MFSVEFSSVSKIEIQPPPFFFPYTGNIDRNRRTDSCIYCNLAHVNGPCCKIASRFTIVIWCSSVSNTTSGCMRFYYNTSPNLISGAPKWSFMAMFFGLRSVPRFLYMYWDESMDMLNKDSPEKKLLSYCHGLQCLNSTHQINSLGNVQNRPLWHTDHMHWISFTLLVWLHNFYYNTVVFYRDLSFQNF